MKKILLSTLLLCTALTLSAFKVAPDKAQIVVPEKSYGIVKFAARELQRHLAMMTGKVIPITAKAAPGKYTFLFEKPAGVRLKPEEAVWEVTPTQTRFYGDSGSFSLKINTKLFLDHRSKTGDLTAVYAFLEEQLGFLFLAPGDADTFYKKSYFYFHKCISP